MILRLKKNKTNKPGNPGNSLFRKLSLLKSKNVEFKEVFNAWPICEIEGCEMSAWVVHHTSATSTLLAHLLFHGRKMTFTGFLTTKKKKEKKKKRKESKEEWLRGNEKMLKEAHCISVFGLWQSTRNVAL